MVTFLSYRWLLSGTGSKDGEPGLLGRPFFGYHSLMQSLELVAWYWFLMILYLYKYYLTLQFFFQAFGIVEWLTIFVKTESIQPVGHFTRRFDGILAWIRKNCRDLTFFSKSLLDWTCCISMFCFSFGIPPIFETEYCHVWTPRAEVRRPIAQLLFLGFGHSFLRGTTNTFFELQAFFLSFQHFRHSTFLKPYLETYPMFPS